jgi:hypothetical protein
MYWFRLLFRRTPILLHDPDDKVFFCTALAGDAKLVTGNIKHYPPAELVVTPAQFCEIAGI